MVTLNLVTIIIMPMVMLMAKWSRFYAYGFYAYAYVHGNGEDDGYLVRVGPKEQEVERNGGNKVNYKPTPGQQHYCEYLF